MIALPRQRQTEVDIAAANGQRPAIIIRQRDGEDFLHAIEVDPENVDKLCEIMQKHAAEALGFIARWDERRRKAQVGGPSQDTYRGEPWPARDDDPAHPQG